MKPFVKIERDEFLRLRKLKPRALALFVYALEFGAYKPRPEETAGYTVTLGHGQFLATDRDLASDLRLSRSTLEGARHELRQADLLAWKPAVSHAASATLYQILEPAKWIRWGGDPGTEGGSIVLTRGLKFEPPGVSGGLKNEPPVSLELQSGGLEFRPPASSGGLEIEPPGVSGGLKSEPPDRADSNPVAQNLAQFSGHRGTRAGASGLQGSSPSPVQSGPVSAHASAQAREGTQGNGQGLDLEALARSCQRTGLGKWLLNVAAEVFEAWPAGVQSGELPLPLWSATDGAAGQARKDEDLVALLIPCIDAATPLDELGAQDASAFDRLLCASEWWREVLIPRVYRTRFLTDPACPGKKAPWVCSLEWLAVGEPGDPGARVAKVLAGAWDRWSAAQRAARNGKTAAEVSQ